MVRVLLVLLFFAASAAAQPARVVKLVEGLEHPWSLAFLPDGRMLVTERPGRLRVIANGTLDPAPIAGLPPVAPHGQGGLMDIALHPSFSRNGLVFLSYSGKGEDGYGTLQQGFLETSNVNIVEEMVNMIQAQRAYEINSKSIQTSDQMLENIAQLKR